jgi:hypothetical protein
MKDFHFYDNQPRPGANQGNTTMNATAAKNPGDRAATIAKHGITIKSDFVPFSQSRNKAEKYKTLNWRVTLQKDGRDVLVTDYSAGESYCPAYKLSVREAGERNSIMRHGMLAWECEHGFAVRAFDNANSPEGYTVRELNPKTRSPILPDSESVIHSLLSDADVLDAGGFEGWASDLGFDPDSRTAEKTYRACLDIALKLRSGLGEAALQELREAFQDY